MSTKSTNEICKSIEQIDSKLLDIEKESICSKNESNKLFEQINSRLLNIEKNSISRNDLCVILAQIKYLSDKLNMMEQTNTPSKIKTTYNRNNILSGVCNYQ